MLHLICPPFSEDRAVYDEMWKNRVRPGWPKLAIVVMRCRKDALWMTYLSNEYRHTIVIFNSTDGFRLVSFRVSF